MRCVLIKKHGEYPDDSRESDDSFELEQIKNYSENTPTETYPFHDYVCGVTGLTCCGCSLFCEHRKEKTNEDG